MKEQLWQFVKFGIVGVSNTAVGYLIYVIALFVLRPLSLSWDYLAASVISFLLSVLWAFYWNNRYVFTVDKGEKRSFMHSLFKMYVSYGFTGLILGNLILWIYVEMGVSKLLAPILKLMVTVPCNFLMNKFWTFRKNRHMNGSNLKVHH